MEGNFLTKGFRRDSAKHLSTEFLYRTTAVFGKEGRACLTVSVQLAQAPSKYYCQVLGGDSLRKFPESRRDNKDEATVGQDYEAVISGPLQQVQL